MPVTSVPTLLVTWTWCSTLPGRPDPGSRLASMPLSAARIRRLSWRRDEPQSRDMRDMSMTLGGTDVRFPDGVWPLGSPPDSLVRLAAARWPSTRAAELPVVAAFVVSAFSPLVAAVADLCLSDYFGAPPADPQRGERTAIVVASSTGDLGTAAAVASAVQGGKRVQPLLFYQSNHNAVAGYIGARWNLAGPVVCTMPCSLSDVRPQAGALDLAAAAAAA